MGKLLDVHSGNLGQGLWQKHWGRDTRLEVGLVSNGDMQVKRNSRKHIEAEQVQKYFSRVPRYGSPEI